MISLGKWTILKRQCHYTCIQQVPAEGENCVFCFSGLRNFTLLPFVLYKKAAGSLKPTYGVPYKTVHGAQDFQLHTIVPRNKSYI